MNENKEIRFIAPDYTELFRIPDGGRIVVTRPMGEMYPGVQDEWIGDCRYMDETHTNINGECYHICQFAEIQARIGAIVKPETEPEIIENYRVTHRTTVGNKVFKFGVNPKAPSPYVTWQGYTDPAFGNDLGHYWSYKRTAERDFFLRVDSERTGQSYDHTTLIEQQRNRSDGAR